MKSIYSLLMVFILISCGLKEPQLPKFNHVFVKVSNLERSIEFYTSAFDLKVTDRIEQLVVTNEDGTQTEVSVNIALLKFPGQDFVLELSQTGKIDTLVKFALYDHIGIEVNDIDYALNQAINAGAELMGPVRLLQTKNLELKTVRTKGPDGELIEFHQIISGEY